MNLKIKNGIVKVDKDDVGLLDGYKWSVNSRGYAVTTLYLGKVNGKYKSKTLTMHKLIMGTPTGMDTDHVNHDRLDNRRSNLRVCTRSQNMMNAKPKKSKYGLPKGVTITANQRSLKRFMVRIMVDGKSRFIGNYMTVDEAEQAYRATASKLQGEYQYA